MASIDLIIKDKSKIDPILSHARGLIERAIVAGDVVVRLCRPNKSREQEEKYHAMINDISKTVKMPIYDSMGVIVEGVNRSYSPEVWKAQLVDDFEQELKQMDKTLKKPGRVIRSLDGKRWITIRPSTTGFSIEEGSWFIEFLYAKGAELGAVWSPVTTTNYNEVMG